MQSMLYSVTGVTGLDMCFYWWWQWLESYLYAPAVQSKNNSIVNKEYAPNKFDQHKCFSGYMKYTYKLQLYLQ